MFILIVSPKSKQRDDESGFTTAWMLGLVLLILFVGGAFYDFSGVLTQRQKIIAVADRASNSGATALDEEALISSDGQDVFLRTGSPFEESAEFRCENVIQREKEKAGSAIETYSCDVDSSNPQVILATVTGKVSYGTLAAWVGVQNKTFTVTSKARPTCSDAIDPVSGAC